MGASDASSYGIGIFALSSQTKSEKTNSDLFGRQAELRLLRTFTGEHGSTLCRDIHPSRGRVLPKMHTPQNGLTVRSLSHNLGFCETPDIAPKWLTAGVEDDHHGFNFLLVPWPPVIRPNQFLATRRVKVTDHVEGSSYGLFSYTGSTGPTVRYIKKLIKDAERNIGRVNGIIFPELAMSDEEFVRLAKAVGKDRFVVGGVGKTAAGPYSNGRNEAVLQTRVPHESQELYTQFRQSKHHRWKLTKSQVLQYGIGESLHPSVNWWERISLERRSLSFVTLRSWLTTSVLICEDLARPDPVGDLLRTVGPNLIIALLCDAPQLVARWPGRYAGAFSDDPGSSVLTMTSLGMASLSQPEPGKLNKSRTIALWRDAKSAAREIEISPNADAILLNLFVEYHEEWTADGRPDGGMSGYPILAGYHQIYADRKENS